MDYCLTTAALCKQYKNFKALNGLSMHVPKGSIYGLVGRNGAGKTTLIRLISGIQEPTSGEYTLYGVKNTDRAIYKVRRRIGAVVETPAIYSNMTAEENLKIQYQILGIPNYDGIEDLLQLVDLADCGKKKTKDFSLGMRQRLGIAVALCGSPDFLVLDEPVNGLDPQGIIAIRELILRLNKEKQITILISSHILDELAELATYYGFVDGGTIVKEISDTELNAACRKCVRLSVTNTKALCRVLDHMGIEYNIISDTDADIYGEISVTHLAMALAQENCEIKSMQEHDESLENYYMNLVGGEKNA
ncbi:ABC transporter ATP-binding protein [Blautia producta]|uniref:ATP-binding cassette domain-containing protein n=1 Tax=Blautia producta TaxID=33035 RepID=UPI001D01D495|nr:ABC transporter ATP-binding protein [Blautia producta]MCB5873807.1 ABC transporter ATP-binding protein [Blautia producta]